MRQLNTDLDPIPQKGWREEEQTTLRLDVTVLAVPTLLLNKVEPR